LFSSLPSEEEPEDGSPEFTDHSLELELVEESLFYRELGSEELWEVEELDKKNTLEPSDMS
jgi:hypothetical protein